MSTVLQYLGIETAPTPSRPFLSQAELRIRLQRNSDTGEDFSRAEMLLIFESKTQHTWLVATNQALYCIIDNIREGTARRLWRIGKAEIVSSDELKLNISEQSHTDKEDFLIVGHKKARKYSRRLFQTVSAADSVRNMLVNAFGLPMTSGDCST